jgi:signal transduction histidine kinase
MQLIDPSTVVRESVDLFVKGLPPADRSVRIDLECTESMPRVQSDPGRLMQVVLNLLSNAREAISRSDRAGRILVRTGTAREGGRTWATIDVIDDGPGIPEAHLGRIFEPFFTTREEGTGYGLYLAAQILKEQSGRITARNNPDRGATFTLWLPEAAGEFGASGASPSRANPREPADAV